MNKPHRNKMLHGKRGFTLIELIVVIAILAVLALIITPSVLGYIQHAKQTNADTAAETIKTATASIIASHPICFSDNTGNLLPSGASAVDIYVPSGTSRPTDAAGNKIYTNGDTNIYYDDISGMVASQHITAGTIKHIYALEGKITEVDVDFGGILGSWKKI